MDPVLNAQVQSPFVRTLSSIPSKTSSYVHGIPDNVPPFSYNKIEVQPYTDNSTTTQDLTHKFRIPQGGILNRAYLTIRTKNYVPDPANLGVPESLYEALHIKASVSTPSNGQYDVVGNKIRFPWAHDTQIGIPLTKNTPFGNGGSSIVHSTAIVDPEGVGSVYAPGTDHDLANNLMLVDPSQKTGTVSNGWNVVNVLDKIELSSNGKLIETVPGECIPSEVVKMDPQLRDFYTKGMIGYRAADVIGEQLEEGESKLLWDPSECVRDTYGRLGNSSLYANQAKLHTNTHVDFIVPVTLSSLRQLSKNYDTKFVEDMELSVSMKELGRGFNATTSGDLTKSHTLSLSLIYHNFHDSIYNSVRDSNFKRGVPASVYSNDWNNAGVAKWVDGSSSLNIELKSRKLVTELVIVAKQLKIPEWGGITRMESLKSDYTFPAQNCSFKVELQGSGRTIVDSTNLLLQGPDSADYDLETRRLIGQGVSHGGRSHLVQSASYLPTRGQGQITSFGRTKMNGGAFSQSGVDLSFGDNFCTMRFGFQTSDEYYTGGLALQTISNPSLIITPTSPTSWDGADVEFNVYVKHALMVRIDSGTGAITRTLDV